MSHDYFFKIQPLSYTYKAFHSLAFWKITPPDACLLHYALVQSPPVLTRTDLCNHSDIVEMMMCDFKGQVTESTCSGEASWCAMRTLKQPLEWMVSDMKNGSLPKPALSAQHGREPPEEQIPWPHSHLRWPHPKLTPSCTLWRGPKPNHKAKLLPDSWLRKLWNKFLFLNYWVLR